MGQYDELVEQMASCFYEEYREKLKDFSDSRLRDISSKNIQIVSKTPVDTYNFESVGRAYAEWKICNEILNKRQAKKDEIKKWKDGLNKRRLNAILNLKTAHSEIGQLVAAIIEFKDGCSFEEISTFNEKLQSMEPLELQKVLENLKNEEIIYEENGTFYILNICTESLFPDDPIEFTKRCFRKANEEIEDADIEVVKLIARTGHPLDRYIDFASELEDISEWRIGSAISKLLLLDVLSENDDDVVYFKMLGERSEK